MGRQRRRAETAEEIAERLSTPVVRDAPISTDELLSTGSTQLNLAFSGRQAGGIPRGTFLYLVGDSGSLKTWLVFTILAEAARNPKFSDYRFIYDGPENGALMELPRYFGNALADRVEPPKGTVSEPVYSETVQEFYYNLDDALDQGPCIYIEDSMDALNADEDEEKFEELKAAHGTNKKVTGSYGMAKAKTNSRNINRVVQKLRKNGSILIVISQTRDKVGGTIPGQKTRGGGRALKFYAHLEAWTSVRSPIMRTYLRKEREIGALIRIDVQKNRVCGWEGKIEIPFLKGYGIDDIGGMIDYLIEERHWSRVKKTTSDDEEDSGAGSAFVAPEFDFEGKREALVKKIQESGDELELRLLVSRVWNEIIAGALPERKARYE